MSLNCVVHSDDNVWVEAGDLAPDILSRLRESIGVRYSFGIQVMRFKLDIQPLQAFDYSVIDILTPDVLRIVALDDEDPLWFYGVAINQRRT